DPEFDFFRWCSWCYVHYLETGKVGVLFLDRRRNQYSVQLSCPDHRDVVRHLRTWLVHHLDASSEADMALLAACGEWLRAACGTAAPRTTTHWEACVDRLTAEVAEYLDSLLRVAVAIEADDDRDTIVADWLSQIRRNHSASEFDA